MRLTDYARKSPVRAGLIILLPTLVLITALLFYKPEKSRPVKIGAIISLTGPASHLIDVRDGIDLAVDEINRWGGINGRQIEIIIADSRSDPEEAKRVFAEMEATDPPLFYIATNSNIAMALAPQAAENRVALLGLVVAVAEFSRQNEWVFRYYTSAENEVEPALFVLKENKIRHLGILYQDEAYGRDLFSHISDEFEKNGGTVRGAAFSLKADDLAPQVAELLDQEAVFVAGFPNTMTSAIKQLRGASFSGILLAASGMSTPAGVATPEAEGVYVGAPLIYNTHFPFARRLAATFADRFARPLTHQAANGYDALQMVAGLLTNQELTRESVRNRLAGGFTYPGIFGEVETQPGSRDILFPLYPARIENGRLRYLK